MKRRKPIGMKRSLLVVIITVHLFALVAIILFNVTMLRWDYEEKSIREGFANLEYVDYHIAQITSNIVDIQRVIMQDSTIRSYLYAGESQGISYIENKVEAYRSLNQIIASYAYISSITAFQWDGGIVSIDQLKNARGHSRQGLLPIQDTQVFEAAAGTRNKLYFGGIFEQWQMMPVTYQHNDETRVLSFLMSWSDVWSPGKSTVLSVNLPATYFESLFKSVYSEHTNICLYDGGGEFLLNLTEVSGEQPTQQEALLRITADYEGSTTGYFALNSCFVLFRRVSDTDWLLIETIPYQAYYKSLARMIGSVVMVVSAAMVLIAALSYLYFRKMVRSLTDMAAVMQDIGHGDLSRRVSAMRYREMDELAGIFNAMMELLAQLMQRQLETEEEKRNLEIGALQSQLNPHFLYNSLTTIRWMASMARAGNVCQALLALTNILHPVFSDRSTTWSLSRELEFIDNYAVIMRYRYGSSFEIAKTVQLGCADCTILRFLLQPVIENAYIHGISGREEGAIEIAVTRQKTLLQILVRDNGVGIDAKKAEQINRQLAAHGPMELDGEGHYGLYNVNRRIVLTYGEGSGLRVGPASGTGAEICILIELKG